MPGTEIGGQLRMRRTNGSFLRRRESRELIAYSNALRVSDLPRGK
jgi:hypothetical protein